MNFITRRALSRRTMLRGIGASLALPMLDSMVPALNAQAAKPVPRLGFVYVSHGIIFDQWKPVKIGRDFELTPNLIVPAVARVVPVHLGDLERFVQLASR